MPASTASICAESSSYASASGTPVRSIVVSAIRSSAYPCQRGNSLGSGTARFRRLIVSFDHRHVVIPEHDAVNPEIEIAQPFDRFAETRNSRMPHARAQYYIGSRYDARRFLEQVGRRGSDHDQVIPSLHPRKI